MPIGSKMASGWRNLFRRGGVERELEAEVRGYVDLLTDEYVAAGKSPEAARRAALLEFGGEDRVKEEVRSARTGARLETAVRDVAFGMRSLSRSPGFTMAAGLALALGIGANTAIFSVVNGILLRPLAYADADRLVVVLHQGVNPVAPANFLDWRAESRTLTAMEAAEYWTPDLTGVERAEHLWALRVTPGMFGLLGARPLLGRTLLAEEAEPGRDHEAVIGYALWQRRFGGDPGIVGRPVSLDGESYTIVGVMPPSFRFAPFWATKAELWAPLALTPERRADRDARSLRVFARLRPGATLEQARAEIGAISARLERADPGTNEDVRVVPLKERVVGDVRPALLALLAAVGLVLLIACANVAHMMLARASVREREVAVRTALGATRMRVVQQLLTESLLLALLGGGAGLLLARLGIRALVALGGDRMPRLDTVGLDGRVLLFTLGIAVLTGVVFGLAPALQSSTQSPARLLREGGRGSTAGARSGRLRGFLVASEFAIALLLLVAAGLMIRSFVALRGIDPGFDVRGVATAVVSVAGAKEAEPGVRSGFYREVLERVRALPGVRSAGMINHLPLTGDAWGRGLEIEGRPAPSPAERAGAYYRVVLPGYFQAMGIRLVRGRDFAATDADGAPGAIIVNEALVRRYFPGDDPIGRRVRVSEGDSAGWRTIVGVSADTRQTDWAQPAEPEFFVPYLQDAHWLRGAASRAAMTLVVRRGCAAHEPCDAAALVPGIRRTIAAIDRNVTLSQVQTMDDAVSAATAEARLYLLLFGVFGVVALVLAAVGIYGVMSYTVARRSHEIGIRMALGARAGEVRRLVVRQAMAPAAAGAACGLVAALALTRLMAGLLYGVGASDPATLVAVVAVLAAVALAGSWLPARRATRADPLATLRTE